MKKNIVFVILTFLLGACATPQRGEAPVPTKDQIEAASVQEANHALAEGKFEISLQKYIEFQNANPQSNYFQETRIGEARSLAGLTKWSESIPILLDVYLKTKQDHPEIAAMAMYYLSFSYEALGDDVKTVTSLLDAKKLDRYLPVEVSQAEIPARLAMLYGKFGRNKEAASYIEEAEKGLKKVQHDRTGQVDKAWLAKTYFQMGSVSTNQLSAENFSQVIQGQKLAQVYLLKALEIGDRVYSQRALDLLKNNYRDLSNLVIAPPDASALLAGEGLRLRREQQIQLGGEFIGLIEHAELYKPIAENPGNIFQVDFYSYVAKLKLQTERALYQVQETMTLTEESEKLNSIKRVMPRAELKPTPLPPKVVPGEDPNL